MVRTLSAQPHRAHPRHPRFQGSYADAFVGVARRVRLASSLVGPTGIQHEVVPDFAAHVIGGREGDRVWDESNYLVTR